MKTLQDAINELNVEYSEFNQTIRFKSLVYRELLDRYIVLNLKFEGLTNFYDAVESFNEIVSTGKPMFDRLDSNAFNTIVNYINDLDKLWEIYQPECNHLDCWVGTMQLFPIKTHLFSIANHFAYRVALEIKESFDNIRQRYITEELDNDKRK